MGKQVYLNDSDIEALELLEVLFDADTGNTGDYSAEEVSAVKTLFAKVL